MSKVLLFIPVFNCEAQIVRVLENLKQYRENFGTILIIDNCSADDTLKSAIETVKTLSIKNVKVIKNRENYSLGGSHKVAFLYALKNEFTHLLVLHGDDQACISDIVPILKSGTKENVDCFLGARFHRESKLIGYSRFRILGNHVLNYICMLSTHHEVLDMGSGLNLYHTRMLKDNRWLSFPNDLTFNVYMLFHTFKLNLKVIFFPISWTEKDQISNARVFRQMFKILKLAIKSKVSGTFLYQGTTQAEYSYDIHLEA